MSLWERFRRAVSSKTMLDPVFGRICFRQRIWDGKANIPLLPQPVVVSVSAGEDGPTPQQRALFSEMLRRFADLRALMATPLFSEYVKIRAEAEAHLDASVPGAIDDFAVDYPLVASPADIWDVAILYRIEVCGRSDVDLCFDHEMKWADDDHQLNVLIKDWEVVDVAYEG